MVKRWVLAFGRIFRHLCSTTASRDLESEHKRDADTRAATISSSISITKKDGRNFICLEALFNSI